MAPPTLTEKSLSAVKWSYLGVIARIASQLVVQIFLARLLGPDAMGLFAIAMLIFGIGSIVTEMGLGSALVQKAEITDEDVRLVFTRTCAMAFCIAGTIFLAAPLLSYFFADPRTIDLIRAMAPVLVLQALSITPSALLKRDLAFKVIQGTQVVSYLGGFLVIGVGAAFLGAGAWSLVAAWIGQTTVAAIMLHFVRRHRIRPLMWRGDPKVRDFANRVLPTNFANWLIENVDNLLVGKLFGATALGLYSVSYNLVRSPANHLVNTLQAVLFPATARAQANPDALRRAYLTVVSGVGLVAFPIFFGIAAVADTVVAALFGDRWTEAGTVLGPLAAAMALHALMAVAGPVLWGKGLPEREFRVQAWTTVTLVAAILIAGRYSVVLVAWAVFAVYALRLTGMTLLVMKAIQLPIREMFRCLRGGAFVAALVVSLLFALDHVLAAKTPVLRLGLEFLSASLVFVAAAIAAPRLVLSNELTALGAMMVARVPRLADFALVRRVCGIHRPVVGNREEP